MVMASLVAQVADPPRIGAAGRDFPEANRFEDTLDVRQRIDPVWNGFHRARKHLFRTATSGNQADADFHQARCRSPHAACTRAA